MDHDVISNKNKEKIIETNGKIWRTPKSKIIKVAEIMNEASIHPMQFTDDLYYAFDIAITSEEFDFLLEMGGDNQSFEQLVKNTSFQEKDIKRIF